LRNYHNPKQFCHKAFLLSSFEDLNQSQCTEFYRKIKAATLSSASSPILDINRAYLKDVYAAETQGRLLTTRDDVLCEVRSWLTEHFGSQRRPRPIIGDLIKVTLDEVLNIIKYFWGGKSVSSDAIQDTALSLPLICQITTTELFVEGAALLPGSAAQRNRRVSKRQEILAHNLATLFNEWL
jgi:hypothetical protein